VAAGEILPADGRLELDARVPELDLATVRPGQPVRVRHGERDINAEVRAVAPVVGADTRLGIVHVALPPDSGLRPGMFAQAEILPPAQSALTVPQEAVVVRDGNPAAFVLPDGSDQVVQRAVTTGSRRDGAIVWSPAVEASENPTEYVLNAELPGVSPENVEISVVEGVLTLRGIKEEEHRSDDKERMLHLWEREYGQFERTFRFPLEVDDAQVSADFANGVLTIRVPKAAGPKVVPRTVPIAKK